MNEILDMLAVSWFPAHVHCACRHRVLAANRNVGRTPLRLATTLMWSRKPPRPVRRTTSHARTANRTPAVRSPQSLKISRAMSLT